VPRPLALLTLASLAVGLFVTAPVWASPTDTLPLTRFTEGQFMNLALGARELPLPLHTDLLGWPQGARFAPLLWPALPIAALVGPVLALNLVFALLPAVNAGCGWAFGKVLGLSDWGCFALGGLLAWNPWSFNTLANGQLEQVPLGGAALVWAAALHAQARGGAALVLPGLAALAVGLAAPHVALAALVGLGVLALLDLRRGPRPRVVLWLVGVGLAVLVVNAYQAPQFAGGSHVFAPRGTFSTPQAAAQVAGIFDAATPARLFLPPDAPSTASRGVAHSAYLGWVVLLAALGARELRWLGVAAALAVLSLGDHLEGTSIPMPAALLGLLSDAVGKSGNEYRLVLGAAVALAAGAAHLARGPRAALLLVGLAWTEVALVRTRGLPLAATPWAPDASSVALAGGSGPVLDLPMASPRCPEAAWHAGVQAAFSGRPTPLVLSFDFRAWGEAADKARALQRILDLPDCAERLPAELREMGFTAVVLHEDQPCRESPAAQSCLEAALDAPTVGADGRWWELP